MILSLTRTNCVGAGGERQTDRDRDRDRKILKFVPVSGAGKSGMQGSEQAGDFADLKILQS